MSVWITFLTTTGTILLAFALALRGEKPSPGRPMTILLLTLLAILQTAMAVLALRKDLPPSVAERFEDSFAHVPVYGERGYVVVNQDHDLWSRPDEPDHLTLWTHRADTWGKYGEHRPPHNVVSRPCAADRFEVQTALRGFAPESDWQQAGLIVYRDFDNYVRLTVQSHKENGTQVQCLQWVLERNGRPQPWGEATLSEPNGFARTALAGPIPYIALRITRDVDRWTFWYSENQHAWSKLAEERFYLEPTHVGLLALHGDTHHDGTPIELDPIPAHFDDLRILPFP